MGYDVMENYLAKSNPIQSIAEHTENLQVYFEELLKAYPHCMNEKEKELVRLAAQYHDYGKANYAFQKKLSLKQGFTKNQDREQLYKDMKEIPHGYLSPAFLPKELYEKYGAEDLEILVNALYYHHTREVRADVEVKRVVDEDLKPSLKNQYKLNTMYFGMVYARMKSLSTDRWLKYAVVKGTLNRLDYLASSKERIAIEEPLLQKGKSLGEIVEEKMEQAGFELRPVQKYMKENTDKNVLVVASTGVGKTEAACLWAGRNKLFYTLPLKVSINAIYQRIHDSDEMNYDFANSILLHSDAFQILDVEPGREENQTDSEEQNDSVFIKLKKARMFGYPVTICTVDQLFTFVYKYLGCEMITSVLRYAHIVIDEIQSYAPDIAAKLVYGLKLITELGGKFAIITATMPPILRDFMAKKEINFDEPKPFLSGLKRHYLHYQRGEFDYKKILSFAMDRKVLIICNTVKKACAVYQILKEQYQCERIHILHSRFQQRDRRRIETELMGFSDGDSCGVWVTTQIVEASLDIDFDVLFTEMCPVDNLLQRLGRCYRKREYMENTPNVYVYDTENGKGRVYDKDIYERSAEFLPLYCDKLFVEEEKIEYINKVYDTNALLDSKYYEELRNQYQRLTEIAPFFMSKEEAMKRFRNIESDFVIDDATYLSLERQGFFKQIEDTLRHGSKTMWKRAEADLMSYTIAVNPHQMKHDSELIPLSRKFKSMPMVYRIDAKYEANGRGLLAKKDEAISTVQII